MSTTPNIEIEAVETGADSELPEGWTLTTLGKLSTYVTSGSRDWSKYYADHGALFVRTQDINQNKLASVDQIARVALPEKVEGKRTLISEGDLLITITGANVGKCALVDSPLQEAYVSQSVALVRPAEGFSGHFIHRQLISPSSDDDRTLLQQDAYGVGRPVLNLNNIRELPICLAPINEQHRIVTKLDDVLSRTDSAHSRLANIPAILKRFRQTVLAAACSGKLTEDWRDTHKPAESGLNLIQRLCGPRKFSPDEEAASEVPDLPANWEWASCDALCKPEEAITYGVIKLGTAVPGGVPVLRSSDVRWLRLETDHIKRISQKIADNYSRTYLKGGEILVTVRGTLGGVAVVPKIMKGHNVSREVAVVPLLTELNNTFISYAIASLRAQKWLGEVTKGVAYTGINIRDLKRLPLPVPPLEEQHEIVRRVDGLFKLADAIEKRVAAASLRAERLTQAILAKAFRGDLVPTEAELARREGRRYEPASVLLERIRAERDKNAAAATSNGKPGPRRKKVASGH